MADALVEKVKAAGIVGAGGAGFPSHVKFNACVDCVIANGAECEPLLACDQTVMSCFADRVVAGLKAVIKGTGAQKGLIALKAKYISSIAALKKAIASYPEISLCLVENFYPAGDEQVLVYEATGRVVPEGGLPLDVGVVVTNVGTLYNVALAYENVPVTSRWLTVHGAVETPFTAEVPIGVSFADVISCAGGITASDYRIFSGGPMMGTPAKLSDCVTKTTGGILIFPANHPYVKRRSETPDGILKRSKSVCDQCMACTEICPRYLLGHALKPHLIMRSTAYGLSDSGIVTSSFLCCDCGVCSYYACPLFLSPSKINQFFKSSLSGNGVKNPHKRSGFSVRSFREERLLPTPRLVSRLGLMSYYEKPAPRKEIPAESFREVTIPLSQHIGAPAIPVVDVGQNVQKGDLIGDIPEGKLGAKVHASISGKVLSVGSTVHIVS